MALWDCRNLGGLVRACILAMAAMGALLAQCDASSTERREEPDDPAGGSGVDVTISVIGAQSRNGRLMAVLCLENENFPNDCRLRRQVPIGSDGTTEIAFSNVPRETYAFAVMHDENGNGRIDMSPLRIPVESVGFSNNVMGRIGPPAFRESAFAADGDTRKVVRLMHFGHRGSRRHPARSDGEGGG